jgi:hypothetical protein
MDIEKLEKMIFMLDNHVEASKKGSMNSNNESQNQEENQS